MEDDGDVDIYSDVGEFGGENQHDAKDLLAACTADLDLLDTSVIPRQDTPVKKHDRPPLITKKPEVSSVSGDRPIAKGSVSHDSSANTRNTPAQPSKVAKAIAALKKENGILRHNISVLYMTAKHLLDTKEKEITSLQRRLDNVVFRRNQGAQDNARDSPKTRGTPRGRSRSPHGRPPEPPGAAQSNEETQPQERRHSPERPTATKPKVDMSEDLQRLYDYNGVKPQHRTEFSEVPLLVPALFKKETTPPGRMAGSSGPAKRGHRTGLGRLSTVSLTPRKREMTPFGGMASPTKSAAQRNARRLVKNSIKKAVASPTKRPRRLELHRALPPRGRRLEERDPVPLRKQPVYSSARQPNKVIDRQPNKMATHRRPLEGVETSSEPNKPLDKAPLSKHSISERNGSPGVSKRIVRPLFEDSSPLRFPPGRNSEHRTRNLTRQAEDSHHIPPKRRRSRSRSLSRSPPPRPGSPSDHLAPSRRSLHDRVDVNHARHRSPRLHLRSPERHYSSPEARGPCQRSQERRSPVPHRHPRLERSMHSPSPPRLSTASRRPLSPGPPRPRSPYYEDKGFGYSSSPPRQSRASQRQLSPGRRPRSPYREDEGLRQLPSPPRLSRASQRLVSPGRRPGSPCREGKGLGHLPSPPRLSRTSQRLGSPGRRPRSPYWEDEGLMQPGSAPRIAGNSQRLHSPGRRPRSPYDRGTDLAQSSPPPRQLRISRRQHSPGRRPRSPCDGDLGLAHSPSPPRQFGISQRQHSPGRRPGSPYDRSTGLAHSSPPPQPLGASRRQHSPGRRPRSPYDGYDNDLGLTHSASPPQQLGISRRRHSPERQPRSPCDGDKGLGHSRTSRRQHSPAQRPKSSRGVGKGKVRRPAGKTLTKKPTKTAPGVALSSVVVIGNAGEQDNVLEGSKPHEEPARVLEEGELSDSD